jgi:hypothetical protein
MNLAPVRVGPQALKSNLIDRLQQSAKPLQMGRGLFKILIAASVAWTILVAGLFQFLGQCGPDAWVNLCGFILIWALAAFGAFASAAVLWWALK